MPKSKLAVKVPIATPRRSGPTRLIATSERDGNSSENAAPMLIAPRMTTARSWAAPRSTSPTISTSAAPNAQREGRAGTECFPRDERPVVNVFPGPIPLGQPGGDRGSEQRCPSSERPDEMEAAGVLQQHADGRAQGQSGPDREAIEANHPSAGFLRRHVDVPGGPRREHGPLTGAKEETRNYQAHDPRRYEVESAGRRREQAADDYRGLAPAPIREVSRDRPADDPGEGKCAAHDPDLEIGTVQIVLDVVGENGKRRADGEESQVGDDEEAGEGRPGRAGGHEASLVGATPGRSPRGSSGRERGPRTRSL